MIMLYVGNLSVRTTSGKSLPCFLAKFALLSGKSLPCTKKNYIHRTDMNIHMVVELVAIIFLVLICTMKNYIHRTDMNTDADEVKHRIVDVGDEEHHHQWYNGNDEGNLFGLYSLG